MPNPNDPSLPISEDELEHNPRWSGFARVPAWYRIALVLGPAVGDYVAESVQLRPEPFVLKRITWATTGDVVPNLSPTPPGGSIQGRCVTVDWQDEFTKFFGDKPMLVSSVFADSQGFLDLPRGLIFSGKQSLSMKLSRLVNPWASSQDEVDTTWHFVFAGFGLLRGEYQSGSAG